MADHLAARAYRSEVAHLRANTERALGAVDRHLAEMRAWLADPKGGGGMFQPQNLGADVADLIQQAAAMKALVDADYLVDGA